MNLYLENLRNLFSDDDKIMYRALLEKKDWINHSFFVIGSLADNQDIEDIFDQKIRFKKLFVNQESLDNNYRVLYLYNEMPEIINDDEFVIKYDFSLLSEREYKMLFANFYPCLSQEDIALKEENPSVQMMKNFMRDDLGDKVIIMDNNDLTSSCFPCRIIQEIITYNNLQDGYKMHLRLLCEKLYINFVEVKK